MWGYRPCSNLLSQPFQTFDAPLFTTWFCSMGTIFFLPFYLSCQMCCRGNPGVSTNHTMDTHSKDANVRARTTPKSGRNGIALSGTGNGNMNDGPTIVGPKRVGVAIILKESIQNLREKGFTFGKVSIDTRFVPKQAASRLWVDWKMIQIELLELILSW